jgi:hypothetical protein
MNRLQAILAGASITLALTGCGTAESGSGNIQKKEDSSNASTAASTPSDKQGQKKTDASNQTESKATPAKQSDTESKADSANPSVRVMEKNLSYSVNGAEKKNTAFLKRSENQHFSMYVLPGFVLTAEEPMKDSLFVKGKDDIFMRIEILPADADWADIENNTKVQLKSVSENIKEVSDPSLSIPNAKVLEANNGHDIVTGIIIKDEKNPVRLTLFTTKDNDQRKAFIEMGKTILKDQKK